MTKTIIIGNSGKTENLKPIVFEAFLAARTPAISIGKRRPTVVGCQGDTPNDFKYVELIVKGYFSGAECDTDLMFAYNDPNDRSSGYLFLGQWNDGVVK